ncbi:MAG: hypothetical protein AAF356_04745 [Planctomycetota bacterium]
MLLDWWRSTPSRKEAPALWRVTRGDELARLAMAFFMVSGIVVSLVFFGNHCVNVPNPGVLCDLFYNTRPASVLLPFLPCIVLFIWNLLRRSRIERAVRHTNGLACPGCRYDLRKIAHNTADHCPECNCDLRRWPVPESWPREVGGGKRKL